MIDRLSKQAVLVPCYKTINIEQMAQLFITYIYWYFGPLESIVSDWGPQFILVFWNSFYKILRIKLKLLIVYYLETDS